MYLVLARKYRPANFNEVWGQKHITDVLKRAIKENRVAHAYLFSGPRGTGKTSVARIFAKSLNCEAGPTSSPCGKCDICKSVTSGTCLDVLEIDGASNRGIDEIRNLRENITLTPAKARFKIYIIDEVHMLTKEACNALLKTLEEPPSYVKFIFATTEPEKIIPTILSRCQRFNFQPFKIQEIESRLKEICIKEGISIEDEALKQIYGFSGGSLRDALGILDQLIVNAENNIIKYTDVKDFLGILEETSVNDLLLFLRQREIQRAILLLHKLLGEGKDPALILESLIKKLKDIVLEMIGQTDTKTSNVDKNLLHIFNDLEIETLLNAISLIIEYKERLRRENMPILLSEILFLKLNRLLGEERVKVMEKSPVADKKKSKEKKEGDEKPNNIFKTQTQEDIKVSDEKKPTKRMDIKSSFTKEDIQHNWSEILSKTKKKMPTLEAALREGTPLKTEGNTLFISFDKKYSFHKSMVEKPSNVKIIEKIISKISGIKEIKIEFIISNNNEESLLDNNEIKKIVTFFNGEVVKLEE